MNRRNFNQTLAALSVLPALPVVAEDSDEFIAENYIVNKRKFNPGDLVEINNVAHIWHGRIVVFHYYDNYENMNCLVSLNDVDDKNAVAMFTKEEYLKPTVFEKYFLLKVFNSYAHCTYKINMLSLDIKAHKFTTNKIPHCNFYPNFNVECVQFAQFMYRSDDLILVKNLHVIGKLDENHIHWDYTIVNDYIHRWIEHN